VISKFTPEKGQVFINESLASVLPYQFTGLHKLGLDLVGYKFHHNISGFLYSRFANPMWPINLDGYDGEPSLSGNIDGYGVGVLTSVLLYVADQHTVYPAMLVKDIHLRLKMMYLWFELRDLRQEGLYFLLDGKSDHGWHFIFKWLFEIIQLYRCPDQSELFGGWGFKWQLVWCLIWGWHEHSRTW